MAKGVNLSPDQLIELYRKMSLIRCFEREVTALYQKNLIQGAAHSYIGEEAVAVGACSALRQDDWITSTHRGHGHCLAKGGDPSYMMAEILGRATGYCNGKGGSMHIADLELGILGANGIVGGGIGCATGAAFASKYRGDDKVTVCFFGDGALHQGVFHECANMAGLWKLPVIYVCEYNCFAEFTHSATTFPTQELTLRAAPYGFPGVDTDGNNVLAMHGVTREAVSRARAGEGPTLIIARTYRIEGHYIGDPLTYRTKEEVEVWRAAEKDPIARFRKDLIGQGILTDAICHEVDLQVEKEMQEAVDFALASPEPELDTLLTDIYATEWSPA